MTKIEWTNETWNPITGCSKISPGCANCYAERMAKRLAGRFGYPKDDPFRVTFHPDKLLKPLKWKKPRMIFVCSMGDLFHEQVDWRDIRQIYKVMRKGRQHIYQILTKRPEIMGDRLNRWFGPRLKNWPFIWHGISAEDQEWFSRRIRWLLQIQAAVRFVSLEPLLGPIRINFANNLHSRLNPDWVIVGCESGPKRRECKLEWVRDIVRQCRAANIAIFIKQLQINGRVSHDPEEWPKDLRIREFPKRKLRNGV